MMCLCVVVVWIVISSRRRHTSGALVTGVQTCALPISGGSSLAVNPMVDQKHAPLPCLACIFYSKGHEADPWQKFLSILLALTWTAPCSTPAATLRRRRSEEHTSELQSLMRISYAVFCLKKKNITVETEEDKTHEEIKSTKYVADKYNYAHLH